MDVILAKKLPYKIITIVIVVQKHNSLRDFFYLVPYANYNQIQKLSVVIILRKRRWAKKLLRTENTFT